MKVYDEYRNVLGNIDTNKQIINNETDEEFRDLAKNDLAMLKPIR